MVGLLSGVSSVLGGGGLAGGLTGGGQSEAPSSATTTTTQTFTSGSMGSGGELTIVYVLLGLILLAMVAGKGKGRF